MKAAIVGVTGYTGVELVRLMLSHPVLEIGTLHSHSLHKNTDELYPHLQGLLNRKVEPYNAEKIMTENDLVFFATPAGFSKEAAADFVAHDFPVIDLSGDLRLKDPAEYKQWYGKEPAAATILAKSFYAVPEFYSATSQRLLSNPGCYATAAILAAAPMIQAGLVELDSLIFDGKSGLSGAGKGLSDSSHYVNVDENMTLYKLNQHQHIPEIIQQLQVWAPELTQIQFTTSLIPVKRGIFMTLYGKVAEGVSETDLRRAYETCYEKEPFVRVQSAGRLPELRQVIGSNFCDIGLGFNEKNRIVTIVAVIDNLVKGASGQAIQNFNKWAGLEETAGLLQAPLYP